MKVNMSEYTEVEVIIAVSNYNKAENLSFGLVDQIIGDYISGCLNDKTSGMKGTDYRIHDNIWALYEAFVDDLDEDDLLDPKLDLASKRSIIASTLPTLDEFTQSCIDGLSFVKNDLDSFLLSKYGKKFENGYVEQCDFYRPGSVILTLEIPNEENEENETVINRNAYTYKKEIENLPSNDLLFI
jgi:hypothetical protein